MAIPFSKPLTDQDEYLARYRLSRLPVLGNGDCLFRAVSVGLFGHEGDHSKLRQEAVDMIRNNHLLFQPYIPGHSLDQYLSLLSQPGTYAGHDCLVALSMLYDVTIMVTLGGGDSDVTTLDVHMEGQVTMGTVHVVYTEANGGHYDAVQDI